ncbi:S41 family peptidase [Ekhidna sp.]|uniref:S41 family peptidase n=1 Tax=Ekhidna sp. TaxID=2608089 RepID=UPI003CCB7FF7
MCHYKQVILRVSRGVLFLAILVLFSTCIDKDENIEPYTGTKVLRDVLSTMQNHSLHKHKINWDEFREQVYAEIDGTRTLNDIYPGIKKALTLLDDNHSFFTRHDLQAIRGESEIFCEIPELSRPLLPEKIGYVETVGATFTQDPQRGKTYAEEIRKQITNQDDEDLIGWIVDLRSNWGGSVMYPAIAGLGPILGEGIAGYFIDADSVVTSWSYRDNSAVYDENRRLASLEDNYELKKKNPKVAVLIGNGVASGGEAVAISFIGRENTKTFGKPTCGLTTGNALFTFDYNTSLSLTGVYMADRNGKNYNGNPIIPDVIVNDSLIIQEAIKWLESD